MPRSPVVIAIRRLIAGEIHVTKIGPVQKVLDQRWLPFRKERVRLFGENHDGSVTDLNALRIVREREVDELVEVRLGVLKCPVYGSASSVAG
jgi:hypothetical protein